VANYSARTRTNYFRVKDVDALKETLAPFGESLEIEVGEKFPNAIYLAWEGDGGWPRYYWDVEAELVVDAWLPQVVAPHVEDEQVAIFLEVGYEKLRYLVGYAVAINNKGETREVGLDDIYELAGELGSQITEAEY